MLDASPTDSTQTLKQKYRALARQTHPDALIGTSIDSEYQREQASIQFAEITAAYKTLSDPKSRLQYDRTLKAKEFTDNLVDSLEGGFRVAFKTAYQTAGTIRNVGAQLDKAREDTAYRLELASKIAQYNTQSKTLKQRSMQEDNRRKELQERLDNRGSRERHPWLEQTNSNDKSMSSYKYKGPSGSSSQSPQLQQELTPAMANDIAKNLKQKYQTSNNNNNDNAASNSSNFGNPATSSKDEGMEETLAKTIDRLAQIEMEYRESAQAHVQSQREMSKARTQLDRIQEQEEKALKALEAAQIAYNEAKEATQQQEREYGEVLRQERLSYSNVEKSKSTLTRQQDRTRETLRQTEDMYVWKENSWLRDEARKAKSLAHKLREKSVELERKANELKRELDSIGKTDQ
ncbi:unnamed protein product [Cylindrotheca closterium]|uniref:J domain-containing protein n=1 Tax=Cylindrotheca closterium TaxID=2856 RepID=A0AAD2FWY3_9STRA|nr:unnamed protein product [Cylindrotheca closterium]